MFLIPSCPDLDVKALDLAMEHSRRRSSAWRRWSSSFTTLEVLHTLAGSGPMRLSELTASERVTQPAMTQLVTRARAGRPGRWGPPPLGRPGGAGAGHARRCQGGRVGGERSASIAWPPSPASSTTGRHSPRRCPHSLKLPGSPPPPDRPTAPGTASHPSKSHAMTTRTASPRSPPQSMCPTRSSMICAPVSH